MGDLNFTSVLGRRASQMRKYPRVRVLAPFPCSLARVVARKKAASEQELGVIYDVSAKGARVMTEAVITPGDRISMNLRLPDQPKSMVIETATVRWGKEQTYGVEFEGLSPAVNKHLQRFIAHLSQSGLVTA